MKPKDNLSTSGRSPLDETDARLRAVTLNIALAIGILSTLYFFIYHIVRHETFPFFVSFVAIIVFGLALWLNFFVPRFRTMFDIVFVFLIGTVFLVLLATQFPEPPIILWCFPFPLLAVFLLGSKRGGIVLIIFNIGVIGVFFFDIRIKHVLYGYAYAIRYSEVMVVISILAYYYESLRVRSLAVIRTANMTLEQRVEEKTKALEESRSRLHQAEKMEAIGLLAGGIAHDFNNQLTGIMAFADLIRENAKDSDEIRECAEGILNASRRSAELTGQLLAFARKANILALPVNIHHVVGEVISLIIHTFDKRVIIQRELAANPSMVLGDPVQLENALLNLALNARDAMPSGGELRFTTETVRLDAPFCKTLHNDIVPGDYLRLSIADTGFGMDRKIITRIFEPFFTTKEQGKGTGMGLPAVYGTVLSHKGAITVCSEPGRGSTFRIFLPLLKDDAHVAVAKEAETAPTEKCHGHVLLVDDEQNIAVSIKKLLQMMGFTVTLCNNGREAVDFYRDSWQSVDIVILDMVMPVMDGKDTFIALKRINPEIVALLASGYSLNGEARSILDLGAEGFIQKPFTYSEIRNALSGLRRRRG
ncbi:MAG: response regulator [Chitinispirillaceae bacterium]|nr:response regulator [Chitinispirillaceae bacterium]